MVAHLRSMAAPMLHTQKQGGGLEQIEFESNRDGSHSGGSDLLRRSFERTHELYPRVAVAGRLHDPKICWGLVTLDCERDPKYILSAGAPARDRGGRREVNRCLERSARRGRVDSGDRHRAGTRRPGPWWLPPHGPSPCSQWPALPRAPVRGAHSARGAGSRCDCSPSGSAFRLVVAAHRSIPG